MSLPPSIRGWTDRLSRRLKHRSGDLPPPARLGATAFGASLRTVAAVLVLLVLTTGCGSVERIQTQQPEVASYEGEEGPARTVPLVVTMEASSGTLPETISSFRFQVGEIHFLAADSTRWTRDASRFEFDLPRNAGDPATLVRTHFHPREIESIALRISNPYAEFGANAGGPLTVRTSDSIRVELEEPAPEEGEPYVIRVTFDPNASLDRDASCRWHFTPRLSGRVDPGALP